MLDGGVRPRKNVAMQQDDNMEFRRGLLHAVLAYVAWGLLPIYFRLVGSVGPIEVVCHRVIWSFVILLAVISLRGEMTAFLGTIRDRRTLLSLTLSAILIGLNWLVYLWAVLHGHIVAASLAYFLNPLVTVLIGVSFLGERLRAVQWVAIAFAAVGVIILGAGAPNTLGISLFLAISFAIYGFVRKLTPVSPLTGLGIETLVLLPPALTGMVWIGSHGGFAFGQHMGTSLLLAGSGVFTSLPLLLFASAARRLPMVMLGLIQYITPTMLFILGVILYREPLSTAQWASFALIWTGLAIFATHAIRARGKPQPV